MIIHLMYLAQLLPGAEKGFTSLLENVLTLCGWRKDLYLGDKLNLFEIPVFFIWGSKDAFEKPESGRSKAAAIKECRFEVVEKCRPLSLARSGGKRCGVNRKYAAESLMLKYRVYDHGVKSNSWSLLLYQAFDRRIPYN